MHLVNMECILVNTENKNQFIMRNSRDTGIWSKCQNNENKNKYENNYLRDQSTLELSKTHIHPLLGHILLVQKYWQLISTKQLWSVPNCLIQVPSTEMSNLVPTCPSQYRNVQVPRCLGFAQVFSGYSDFLYQ